MAVAIVEMVEPALSQNFEGASEYFLSSYEYFSSSSEYF